MKKVIFACLVSILSVNAFAQSAPPQANAARFAEHKAQISAKIQEHIAKAQAHLACVQAAQNHEALKQCHPH